MAGHVEWVHRSGALYGVAQKIDKNALRASIAKKLEAERTTGVAAPAA
jgi:hypothetical protein